MTIDLSQFDGMTPGPWKAVYLTREAVVEAPCGRVLYCVPRASDGQVDADAAVIAAAPDLIAEVRELRANLAAAETDANRYRALKEFLGREDREWELIHSVPNPTYGVSQWLSSTLGHDVGHEEIDAAIDAALAGGAP